MCYVVQPDLHANQSLSFQAASVFTDVSEALAHLHRRDVGGQLAGLLKVFTISDELLQHL